MTTEEKGKKIILTIENADVELKRILNAVLIYPNVNRQEAKAFCDTLIASTKKQLEELEANEELIQDTILSLQKTFLDKWPIIEAYFEEKAKESQNGAFKEYLQAKRFALMKIPPAGASNPLGIFIKTTKEGYDVGFLLGANEASRKEITNLRDFLTEYDEASEGYYINYPETMRNEMANIQVQIANGTLQSNGKSLRAQAELSVRYNMIQDDLKKIGQGGFVVSTQHSNASERCSWWQGKIFIVDFDVESRTMSEYPGASVVRPLVKPIGKVDGKDYYSLKTACENGFLSYNCQHRLVKYERGLVMPKPLDPIMVNKRRNISQHQRYLERCIREAKTDELVLNGVDRQKAIERSQKYQQEYADFCREKNVPRYTWRTQVRF